MYQAIIRNVVGMHEAGEANSEHIYIYMYICMYWVYIGVI